jgi:hypothetical protein
MLNWRERVPQLVRQGRQELVLAAVRFRLLRLGPLRGDVARDFRGADDLSERVMNG